MLGDDLVADTQADAHTIALCCEKGSKTRSFAGR